MRANLRRRQSPIPGEPAAATELAAQLLEVPQHPRRAQLRVARAQERGRVVGDAASRRGDAEQLAFVPAAAAQADRRPLFLGDDLAHLVVEVGKCRAHLVAIEAEAIATVSVVSKRTAENEVGAQQLIHGAVIPAVPRVRVEALHEVRDLPNVSQSARSLALRHARARRPGHGVVTGRRHNRTVAYVTELVALLAAGVFAGGAVYVSVAE